MTRFSKPKKISKIRTETRLDRSQPWNRQSILKKKTARLNVKQCCPE